ncbi:MAG: response regulator [Leptolyngbya sp. SIO4C1]|nr:response regulator [Leptolyngbya sp. SIO4C1]
MIDDCLRLLIVDDDEVDRMSVRRALTKSRLKFELSEVDSAEVAAAVLKESAFDCAFLDYRLPGQSGLSLVRLLRESGVRIPLIILTGQGDEETAVSLMKAGASDYISKAKISSEALSRALQAAIRIYKAEQETAMANQRLRETNELLIRKNRELELQREQIQRQNMQLTEVSRLKSEFLATMSHELRTPLNAIIGFSQILLRQTKGNLTSYQIDMVSRVLSNGQNLLALISDILDISKIEAGRLELKLEEFDLAQLIQATVDELRSLADQKELLLKVEIALEDSQICNDYQRMRQILTNLLSNAIKFTEDGCVHLKAEALPANQILLSVKDTGIGIAADQLEHIFDAFHQVDQTVTRKHQGTGLGLAITDLLLNMMQGSIAVESEYGQGSCFQIRFPRRLSAEAQTASAKSFVTSSQRFLT